MQIGSRMKDYEERFNGDRLMPMLPSIARVDGRNFHSFTSNMKRPFDPELSLSMVETAIAVAKECRADIVYVHSDEISFGWNGYAQHPFFDGRVFKISTTLSAMTTLMFNVSIKNYMSPNKVSDKTAPTFDARCFSVPDATEYHNYFLWREMDAVANSVSMAAGTYFDSKKLLNKTTEQKRDMLFQIGIDVDSYPMPFTHGTYIVRKKVVRQIVNDGQLPPKHNFVNKDIGEVVRTKYVVSAKSLMLDKCDISEL